MESVAGQLDDIRLAVVAGADALEKMAESLNVLNEQLFNVIEKGYTVKVHVVNGDYPINIRDVTR